LRAALSVILRDYDEKAAIGPAAIDEIVSRLDAILSERMDEALHHPDFVDLSKTWLSLKALTDRLDFQENVVVEIFNATLEELYEDFADVPELNLSTMFRIAYSEEYGQYGGKPFAAILGAYEFGDSPMEFYVLNRMSALGAMAHAPFIGTPGPGFFGMRSLGELSRVFDLNAILDEKRHENYRELRTRENSRYLALVLPGFLARLPHSPALNPVGEFNYSEGTAGDPDLDYVWGHSSFLLAARMARSFAKTGWYSDFVGAEGGGLVDDLPVLEYESMGKVQNRISTRLVIGEKLENQLSNSGFIPFVSLGNTGKASFNFAQTVLKPKESPADPRAAFNHRISTMLPNLMLINRLAHHIKVLQRENVGTWKDSLTLERELNNWLNQYVTDMDNPSDSIRAKRPLRSAKVTVTDLPDTPGWHSMTLSVRPHMKFLGADFTLTIQGRLDRADFPGT
jgi:type VI secretion system protein ImpC